MNQKVIKALFSFVLVGNSVFAQVRIDDQCRQGSNVLIGLRVGEKIYAKDTVRSSKLEYQLPAGFYALVREGQLLGDFIVPPKERLVIKVYCDSISTPGSEVNNTFSLFVASSDSLKTKVFDQSNGEAKQVLSWCYPQLLVPSVPKANLTNAGLNEFFCEYLKSSDPFLANSPFFELNLEYYLSQLINQDADTLIKYIPKLELALTPDNKAYAQRLMLHRFESSKVLGHENVFIDLALRTIGKGISLFDSATDAEVLRKAKLMYPNRIGTKVADFRIKTLTGNETTLLSASGLYKLVFFYDPDCHHCKESFPAVKSFAKDFRDKGVEVYAVSTGIDRQELDSFIAMFGTEPNLHYVWDPNVQTRTFRDSYHIPSTPTIYLVNQAGVCLARSIASAELVPVFNHIINN